MNLKKHLIVCICWLLCVQFGYAQKYAGNYNVLLKSGTETFENNLNQVISNPNISPTEVINGYYYRLLQFKAIPTTKDHEKIARSGVLLLEYIPHKTYIAAIPQHFDLSQMSRWNVRSVQPIKALNKLSNNVLGPVYPVWADQGNSVSVVISCYDNLKAADVAALLQKNGVVVTKISGKTIDAVVLKQNTVEVANLAGVAFMEASNPPAIPEDRLGQSLHRSSAINTLYAGGKKFNGSGVNILVRDDGTVGPHIDFQNRTDQSSATVSTIDNHGDGVAGIASGAGNLDPMMQGMAPGAFTYVIDYTANYNNDNTLQLHQNNQVMVTNSSYSDGCNGGYTNTTRAVDGQTYSNPTLLHVFSGGNSNNSDCGYGAGTQWGNITGGHKMGKNVIATANVYADGTIVSSSSRGPAHDGRIKPDIAANGQDQMSLEPFNGYSAFGGTSGAAPNIMGISAQLIQAYRQLNNNADPEAALLKATLMNSAQDYGNPGPDFTFGYGIVNAYEALKVIENGNYWSANVAQGGTNTHNIVVPNGVKQLRVMTYWTDNVASLNANPALVNDLDATLTDGLMQIRPWVLNPAPNPVTLNQPAVRAVDDLNNVEQITLNNPTAGTYPLTVTGSVVPFGNVKYYVVVSYIMDELTLIYPMGGEGLIPGTVERIHWDAFGNQGQFNVSFTTDDGNTWYTIANLSGDVRMFDWTIPNVMSGQVRVRISRAGLSDESNANLSITHRPANVKVNYICANTIQIGWDALAGATGYDVFMLGYQYMDSIGTTTNTYFDVPTTTPLSENWFAVRAVGANGLRSRRTIAIQSNPTNFFNCLFANDLSVHKILSSGDIPTCSNYDSTVVVQIFNNSTVEKSNFSVAYEANGSIVTETYTDTIPAHSYATFAFNTPITTIQSGTNSITAWTAIANDDFSGNDTTTVSFGIVAGQSATIPLSENFETFATCPVATDCGTTICGLGNGWTNLANGTKDDIDWRVNAGATPSANTGPDFDHTLGNNTGRYIYLEASACFGQEAILTSPCVDLTNATAPELTFWYHLFGAAMGELHVDIFDGTHWIEDATPMIAGDQGNAWQKRSVNLAPFVGKFINIRFRGITGATFTSDMALDDIGINEVAVAPNAAFQVSQSNVCLGEIVQLSDLSSNVPTAWTWTITPATFSFVNGTTANSQNPQVALNGYGTYTVQLNVSNPNGANSTVQNNAVVVNSSLSVPYTENFQSGTFPPANMTIENPDNGITWASATVTGSNGNASLAAFLNNFAYNGNGAEDALSINLNLAPTLMSAVVLSFDVAHARYNTTFIDGLRIDVYSNCGSTYEATVYFKEGNDLATVPNQTSAFSPTAATHWRKEIVDLSDFIGMDITLKIINENGYGNNTYIDNINIIDGGVIPLDPPTAAFNPSVGDNCVGATVSFFDASTGDSLTYNWDFGQGAIPATANTAGPHNVVYTTPGTKTAKLFLSNSVGTDSTVANVSVKDLAVAIFSVVQQNDSTFKFFQGALNATAISWDFGDGTTSTAQNPLHTYDTTGTYPVTLYVIGDCGNDTAVTFVTATTYTVGTNGLNLPNARIQVLPNPSNGQFTLHINGLTTDFLVKIMDMQGRIIQNKHYNRPTAHFSENFEASDLPKGVYLLQIQTEQGIETIKLLIQ